jgi:hypothetical protein
LKKKRKNKGKRRTKASQESNIPESGTGRSFSCTGREKNTDLANTTLQIAKARRKSKAIRLRIFIFSGYSIN